MTKPLIADAIAHLRSFVGRIESLEGSGSIPDDLSEAINRVELAIAPPSVPVPVAGMTDDALARWLRNVAKVIDARVPSDDECEALHSALLEGADVLDMRRLPKRTKH